MKSQTRSLTQPETLPTRATVVPSGHAKRCARLRACVRFARAIPALCGVMLLLLIWRSRPFPAKAFRPVRHGKRRKSCSPIRSITTALTIRASAGMCWPRCSASLSALAAALVGIPTGFLLGRFAFVARMFNPVIALLRPVSRWLAAYRPAAVPARRTGLQLDHFYLFYLADDY